MSSSSSDPNYINSLIKDVAWYGIEFMLKLPQYANCNANAFKELVEIGKPAVGPLIDALLHDDLDTRRVKIAMVLGEIGDPQAIEPLNQILHDKNDEVVKAARDALEKIKVKGSLVAVSKSPKPDDFDVANRVESLLAALNYETKRQDAIKELGTIGDPRAFLPLFQISRDNHFSVIERQMAADALENIQWVPKSEKEKFTYWIWKKEWEKFLEMGAPAVEPLLLFLRNSQDETDISSILQTIVKIGPAAVDPLLACLQGNDTLIQIFAAKALGMIHAPRAGDALWNVSGQSNLELQKNRHILSDAWESLVIGLILESALALNRIKDIRGVITLIDALFECYWFWDDSSDGVSTRFNFEIKRAVNEAVFHKKEWDPISEAAETFTENVPEAIDALASELLHTSFEKRFIIIKLLQTLKTPRSVEPLIEVLNMKHNDYFTHEITSSAAEALGHIGDDRAVEPLIHLLDKNPGYDDGEKLRTSAILALGNIGDRHAINALLSARNNQYLQSKVDTALQQLGWRE